MSAAPQLASVLLTQATLAAAALLGSIALCLLARTAQQTRAAFWIVLPLGVYFLGLLVLLVQATAPGGR